MEPTQKGISVKQHVDEMWAAGGTVGKNPAALPSN
jgi:hypothetical protein